MDYGAKYYAEKWDVQDGVEEVRIKSATQDKKVHLGIFLRMPKAYYLRYKCYGIFKGFPYTRWNRQIQ